MVCSPYNEKTFGGTHSFPPTNQPRGMRLPLPRSPCTFHRPVAFRPPENSDILKDMHIENPFNLEIRLTSINMRLGEGRYRYQSHNVDW